MATRKKKAVKKAAKTSKKSAKKAKPLDEQLKTAEGRAEFRQRLAEAAANLGERIKVKATPPAESGKEARMNPADTMLKTLRDQLQGTVEPVQDAAKKRMKNFAASVAVTEEEKKPEADPMASLLEEMKQKLQRTINRIDSDNAEASEDQSLEGQLVSRLIKRGLLASGEAGAQRWQIRSWSDATINALNDFMKNAPAGSFTSELSREIQKKFDIIWDPPATRFTGVFRRLPILIRKREAARLDKQLLDAVRGKDKGYQMKMLRSLHLMPSEIAEMDVKEQLEKEKKDAEKAPRMSRLEELAHGGIKAESDSDWFEKFNPTKVTEEKQQGRQMSTAEHLEVLETDYAEKTRQFLKAKRELAAAKRALDRGYKEAEEKEAAQQEVVTVTDAKPTILEDVEQSLARNVLAQVSKIQEMVKNGQLKSDEVDGLPSHGVSKEAVDLWKKHFGKKQEEPSSDQLKGDFDALFHGRRF
jgi:hypothetical protein